MATRKVLVTGIGGNVGQGIIRNIRATYPQLHITGVDTCSFSAGNHLCDVFYTVPYAWSDNYIGSVQHICATEKIELVIPSTDSEVFYLAKNRSAFAAVIAASGASAAGIYLDKYLSWQHHHQHHIPFAAADLPSAYNGQFMHWIAKPRKGRGSRGLLINPTNWADLKDEEYIIQELHTGKEITTAFYVDKHRRLHGMITLLRYLENGATTQCKVVFDYDAVITPILQAMIAHSDICGAANLQSIVCEDGSIQPFEINCRISGTNSIRSNFGFEDVKYTLQEYLFNETPAAPAVIPGVAVRILMDIIYKGQDNFNSCRDNKTAFTIF